MFTYIAQAELKTSLHRLISEDLYEVTRSLEAKWRCTETC